MAEDSCLEDVLINEQLELRPSRPARLDVEVQALHRLMQHFSKDSSDFLDDVVQTSCELLNGGSAGITLEETLPDGTKTLRWTATTGLIRHLCGQRMRRDHSPCGVVLDRNQALLFYRPKQFFQEIDEAWNVVEALLVPWHVRDEIVGTLWVMSHSEARKFDREDLRILDSLANFAELGVWKDRVEAKRREQEVTSAKNEFANQLAHQINNPLQALTNSLHLIDAGASSDHLQNAKLELERVSHLVRAILELGTSRNGAGAAISPRASSNQR